MRIESGLVKLEEKHGTYLFKFSSIGELYSICLKIVKARHKSRYWGYPERPKPLEDFDFVPEQTLKTLPKSLYDVYVKQLKDYNFNLGKYKRQLAEYEFFQEALKNGSKAYEFLESRSDYEYENFDTIVLNDIDRYEG